MGGLGMRGQVLRQQVLRWCSGPQCNGIVEAICFFDGDASRPKVHATFSR